MTGPARTGQIAALILLGAALTAVASLLRWVTVEYRDDLRGAVTATGTGGILFPGLLPLAGVAVAALGALLALRGVPRRLVGALVAVTGVGVAVMGVAGLAGTTGGLIPAAAVEPGSQVSLVGPGLAVVGAVVLIAAGILGSLQRTVRTLGSRYERTDARRAISADPELAMWKALDAHIDPTSEPARGSADPAAGSGTDQRSRPSNAADG